MTCPKMTKGTTWEYDNHWEITKKKKKKKRKLQGAIYYKNCGKNIKCKRQFIMNIVGTT